MHRKLTENIADHLEVARVDDDRLRAVVHRDDGDAESIDRDAVEERLDELPSALHPAGFV